MRKRTTKPERAPAVTVQRVVSLRQLERIVRKEAKAVWAVHADSNGKSDAMIKEWFEGNGKALDWIIELISGQQANNRICDTGNKE